MLDLFLARHGQAYGNVDRSLGPDTDLTALGRQQAARLGAWLAEQGCAFTAFYASPLRRARQTAEIINEHFGLEISLDPELRETEIPYLGMLPRRDGPLGEESAPPFNPEYEQMRVRVAPATARILADNPEGHVLVVAHAGTLSTILRTILGTHALILHTDLAAVHALRWKDGVWTLKYLNRQEHL
jgi:broad specificity phosphatase PhoE